MKAVVCRNKILEVVERPEPQPGRGQVLVKILRCGICGSDLHVREHCDEWGAIMARSGYRALMSSNQEVIFGHEFSAEIIDYGAGSKRSLKVGTHVVAMPALRRGDNVDLIGLAEHTTGAYAERMLVEESLMMPVPNGLAPDLAALTEPMAVGWHALNRGEVKKRDVAVVIGCGPVGLAIISLLKARGVQKIIAADLSEGRRRLATECGAHIVVNPSDESPYAQFGDAAFVKDAPQLLGLLMDTSEKLRKLPLPWWYTWRVIEKLVGNPKAPVVFECVGAKGVLQSIIEGVPHFTRIVVVGVCMQSDKMEHAVAINKQVDLRYAVGYSPLEFRDTLHLMSEGKVDCAPIITGKVGLDGVNAAFKVLSDPARHAKILIDPETIGAQV